MTAALSGMLYYGSGNTVTPPNPSSATAEESPLSAISSLSSVSLSAYPSIATTPGRPPTVHQVQKAEDREIKNRRDWQERFQKARQQQDEQAELKALEDALLKGTGVSLDAVNKGILGAGALSRSNSVEGDSSKGIAAVSKESEAVSTASKARPIVGQDRRDRGAEQVIG